MVENKENQPTDLIDKATQTSRNQQFLGGPGTWMPSGLESFLGWSLALGCLTVSGYHYIVATVIKPTVTNLVDIVSRLLLFGYPKIGQASSEGVPNFPCWLPLTTYSRMEIDRRTASERYDQLQTLLENILGPPSGAWTDDNVIEVLRSLESARRLSTLFLFPRSSSSEEDATSNPLAQQLKRIWRHVLPLPPARTKEFQYDISLILPAFRERGSDLDRKLDRALKSAQSARTIEVVIVDAGDCIDLDSLLTPKRGGWGDLHIFQFRDGGGRGPCLNFGAAKARGRLYTFCHADTTLPHHWDAKVKEALDTIMPTYRPNSCAFKFGIDTSPQGLAGGPYPPGIKAVETTANIRTQLYSLPYGDQVLSVPAIVFDYLGGYPDQCLMEDYELVSLLRQRAALLPRFEASTEKEKLVIIGGPPSLCSPRRWQRFGVLYVTWHNSKFVNLYAGGLGPNELYQLYYGRPPPTRAHEEAPWEVSLMENR